MSKEQKDVIEHYKKKGIKYEIPGDKSTAKKKGQQPTTDAAQTAKKKEYKDGYTTTVFRMAQEAT